MPTQEYARWADVLQNEPEAVRLVEDMGLLSQIWDDLVDGDRAVPPQAVSKAFWLALVGIPENHFFRRHRAMLQPLMRCYITCWLDANELERGTDHDRTVAFVLRDVLGDVIIQCAGLIGGYDYMRSVGPRVRRMVHDETLGEYLEGLT